MIKFNEPLGQPQGTVRAIIAMTVIGAALANHFIGSGDPFMDTLAGAAFGFYFGGRATETQEQPRAQSEVLAPTTVFDPNEDEQEMDTTKLSPGE
jgi:hypothetical protein